MTKHSAARITSAVAIGLLLASAMLYLTYYGSVTAHVTDDFQPVITAVWLGCTINFVLLAAVVFALRSTDGSRTRAVLLILALNPLSIAVLQILYQAPWPPATALLIAALAMLATAQLGSAKPPTSVPAA